MVNLFKNKEKRVRTGWKILFVLVSSIFLDSVINSVFSLKVNNKSLFGENGFIELLRSPSLFFIIVVLFVVLKVERQQLSSIGLCMSKKSVWHFINGFLYGGGSIAIVLFVLWCLGNLTITNSIFNPHFSDFEWVVLFTSSLFPGVGEELLFRGYFLNLIHNSIGRGWSICLTSLLFSLIHGGNEGYSFVAFTNIFILSVVLAFVTIRTKTIWTAISFHISWNFLQGSIFSVPVSGRETSGIYGIKLTGNDLITGGSFGIEGSIVTLVVLVVLAIILMNITSANNWRISRTINI